VGGAAAAAGGGGSGGSYQGLLISNEASPLVSGNDVTITWNTSYYSTSQVIFGPESGAPYNLNIAQPNFGYASSSPDFINKVINHSVTIYNIPPGNYLYRVVSHASPPTISFEHYFSVPAERRALAEPNISAESMSKIAQNQNNAQISKNRTNKNIISAINSREELALEETVSNDANPSNTEKIISESGINAQENISKEPSVKNQAAVFSVFDEVSGSLKYIFIFLFIVGMIWVFFIRRKES
ncbi:MAG: hypothetical protein AAB874_06655, partial [Patescibacteria group bacterium]